MRSAKPLLVLLAVLSTAAACDSHYFSLNGTCLECNSTCLECAGSPSACTACQQQFYLNGISCLPCNSSCTACSDYLTCSSCAPGFRLNNSQCLPCGTNCAHCSDIACRVCTSGYDIKSNCGNCAAEYYWNSTMRQCAWCGMGCSNCNSTQFCLSCLQNYKYLTGNCSYLGTSDSQSSPSPSSNNQQVKIQIILASVFGGLFVAAAIAYLIYCACFRQKKNKIDSANAISSSVGEISLSKSDSIVEELSKKGKCCLICNQDQSEATFSCGHSYHNRCLIKIESNSCLHCTHKEVPLFLDDILGELQVVSSQISSQAARKDVYRCEDTSNNASILMEMPKIDIQQ